MSTEKAQAKLIIFAQRGDRVYCGGSTTISGYGTPEKPHAAAGLVIPDGCPVIDNRATVDTPEGFGWVFSGPMLDVDLPDGAVNACPMPSETMRAGLQGAFSTLATLQTVAIATHQPRGPLDFVGIAEYVQGWKEHGARVGHYQNGHIVWEEGT